MKAELLSATTTLIAELERLSFSAPTEHVYNPLVYAAANYRRYLERFGCSQKRVIFLGMNPGPFGMAQTGVPFGDIPSVRDYLCIDEGVVTPSGTHPKRPVLGLACPRVEVSGQRLWGAIRARFSEPEAFFRDHFVANYCPLAFMEASGRNRTPDKLPRSERDPLYAACDRYLQHLVATLQPAWLIGIGKFAADRARAACGETAGLRIASVLHPSPASPAANRGWQEAAWGQLAELGVCVVANDEPCGQPGSP